MANREAIEDELISAVSASLLRLAGGGFQSLLSSSSASSSSQQWIEQLRKVSKGCISFPNNVTAESNTSSIDGKPHDVECRAALSLFHIVRNRICTPPRSSDDRRERKSTTKGPRKKKKKKDKTTASSSQEDAVSFELISELGTQREICNATKLANLLSLELEKELSSSSSKHYTVKFFDIRSNDSGIIYMVSDKRSNELHEAGKLPCSHCVRWYKGQKGLWWHQLQAHGICYASATESAADAVNSLAVVPYQAEKLPLQHTNNDATIILEPTLVENNNSAIPPASLDPFEMVKAGEFDKFVNVVESGTFSPANEIDRNGATALHWAAGAGSVLFVRYLVETCQCNPNEKQKAKRAFRGRTPLHWAARNGHLEVVKYLIAVGVDIDATTQDGTTAFCWSAWQCHLDVMKFLSASAADIHAENSFGCNAVLWTAQGDTSIETLEWLQSVGLDFYTVNSNGHTALHKAAQRGSITACKWIVDTFMQDFCDPNALIFIGPDAEGHCPSDLCSMDGHKELAEWMITIECSFIRRYSAASTNFSLPAWLQKEIDTSELAASGRSHCAVRCMVDSIVLNNTAKEEDWCVMQQKKARLEDEGAMNLCDID